LRFDVQLSQVETGFAADEFPADFVVRRGFALDQDDLPPSSRKMRRDGGAGNSTANY
jgi:hypothetical protein